MNSLIIFSITDTRIEEMKKIGDANLKSTQPNRDISQGFE